MSITFTENAVYGVSPGGFGNGVVQSGTVANGNIFPNNLAPGAAGTIIKVYHFADATVNINTGSAQQATVLSSSFTRLRTDTSILVMGFTPVAGQSSYRNGMYFRIGPTRKFESCVEVSPPIGHGTDGVRGYVAVNGLWKPEELIDSLGVEFSLGWQAGLVSSESFGNYYNPSELSGRQRTNTTCLAFFELLDDASFINEDTTTFGPGRGQ